MAKQLDKEQSMHQTIDKLTNKVSSLESQLAQARDQLQKKNEHQNDQSLVLQFHKEIGVFAKTQRQIGRLTEV